MTLQEVRAKIDEVDPQIRELLMKRMDCSHLVAEAKNEAGSTTIYRADREAEILERLSAGVPEDRKAEYLAVVRKIMEASRMYQYGLLYDWNEKVFDDIPKTEKVQMNGSAIRVRLTRPDQPGSVSAILSIIGDYGCNMRSMELIGHEEDGAVTFDLAFTGSLSDVKMRKLVFQLSKESSRFCILETM